MANNIINSLLSTLLSGTATETLEEKSGANKDQVSDLLAQALPALLKGMATNASDEKGAAALDKALEDHSKTDVSNPAKALANADEKDGAKIVGHLLGDDSEKVQQNLAKNTGLSSEQITSILGSVAPVVMSMMGNQKKSSGADASSLAGLLSGLMSGKSSLDLNGLLSMAMKDGDGDGKSDVLEALGGLSGLFGKK